MRLLIDLQGAQTESRHRGIGHYSCSFALALIQVGVEHDISILLNAALPESTLELYQIYSEYISPEKIHLFSPICPVEQKREDNRWNIDSNRTDT